MFQKPATTIDWQIEKLIERGLQIENKFTIQLASLFEKYPNVDINALGIKPNWKNEPLWLV